jgi:N-acetylmuramoyl-L-alanine amidase
MKNILIILDPAHGRDTLGKRSPDGSHLEYKWSRNICVQLKPKLEALGYRVEYSNPPLHSDVSQEFFSEFEVGLMTRVRNTQKISIQDPEKIKLLISLHNNAAGDGAEWMKGRGVEIYTCSPNSDSNTFALTLINILEENFPQLIFREDFEGDKVKHENFTVLTGKGYNAILLEWLFQDNRDEVKMLADEEMNAKLVESIIQAVEKYNNAYTN